MARTRRSELGHLVRQGQLDSVRRELADEPDDDWATVAFVAIIHAPELVKELLDGGLPIDVEDLGRTLLAEACRMGETTIVCDLLERGADPLKAHPLVLAAREGHEDCVGLLLDAGVPPDRTEPGRRTALGEARFKKHASIEARLIAAGATQEQQRPRTMGELFEQVNEGELDRWRFDEELWERIASRPHEPDDLEKLGEPILLSWAHRYFETQYGNGGLSQAVFNMLRWFPAVGRAFETLGFPEHASVIERAATLAATQGGSKRPVGPTTFGKFMGLFKRAISQDTFDELEGELARLRLSGPAEARIDYILVHQEAFMAAETQLFVPRRSRSGK